MSPPRDLPAAADAAGATPGLARRLACFVYEGVLLFGVLMISGWIYSTLTQQRHALQGRHGLQAFLFVALAVYFVWFWSRGGQTVAMKTWQVRLLDAAGKPVSQPRALARYLASWIWFAPAIGAVVVLGLHSVGAIFGALALGVVGYALLALAHPRRQFWHDALCGTQLVRVDRPEPKERPAGPERHNGAP